MSQWSRSSKPSSKHFDLILVGSNPSIYKNSDNSPTIKNIKNWLKSINFDGSVLMLNVSWNKTENNRPIKRSEYQLEALRENFNNINSPAIVALGNIADDALNLLQIPHIKLPHPSPRNRKLNDKIFVQKELEKLYNYLVREF